MKNFILKTLLCCLLAFSLQLQAQSTHSEIQGVWKYQLADNDGMSIISPTHFIWVISNKDRQAFANAEPTAEEKATAFDALNVAAGTWVSMGKNRIKFTFTQHGNANLIGNSFEWEYEKEGDFLNYWIIQDDGSRSPLNNAGKLAEWDAPGTCAIYNGVWEYEGLGESAIYIQSGNYGAWLILENLVTDLSTVERKAKAFDAVNSNAVIGDCRNGKKDFWNVQHAADIRDEKTVIGSTSKKISDGYYGFQILNKKGELAGLKWRIKQLAK